MARDNFQESSPLQAPLARTTSGGPGKAVHVLAVFARLQLFTFFASISHPSTHLAKQFWEGTKRERNSGQRAKARTWQLRITQHGRDSPDCSDRRESENNFALTPL